MSETHFETVPPALAAVMFKALERDFEFMLGEDFGDARNLTVRLKETGREIFVKISPFSEFQRAEPEFSEKLLRSAIRPAD